MNAVRSIVAGVLCLAAGVVSASPAYKAEVTVSGYAGAEALADFPVLVRLSPETVGGFDGGQCAEGGADLSFVDGGENPLDFEIDTWNPNGESLVWVRVPSLANGTTFFVQWGDDAVFHEASATWNANYGGVWHLGEADGVCANSTRHGSAMDATPKGKVENSVRYTGDDAPVGGARQTATDAALGYLSVPSYDALGFGNTFTISGWIRFDGVSGYPRLFSRKKTYNEKDGWEIEMGSGSYTSMSGRGGNQVGISATLPSPGLNKTWVHVAFVYSGTTLVAYANGVKCTQSGSITATSDCGYDLSFGCDSDGNEAYVRGEYDECRLMGGAASADWVKAEYDTVRNAAFLTYGEAEEMTVDPNLSLGKPGIRATACNQATVAVNVRGLGEGATSATIKLVFGETAGQLASEQAAGSVTKTGSSQYTLKRLYPDRKYYLKAVAENNLGQVAESEVVEFATPALKETSGYPGLNQTFFTSANADWTKDYSTLPMGTDWTHYTDSDRIYRRELGTLAAYMGGNPKATKRKSAVWGDDVYWPVNGGQWIYWGTMYMDAAKTYKFRMKIDDNERVVVTDAGTGFKQVLLNDINNGNGVVTSSAFTPSVTGWHTIEIRMSDGTGGVGGYNTTDGYLNTENMGWSDDNGSTWKLMMDPGDGSLLRTVGAAAMAVTENISAGQLKSVKLSFDASDSARDLYVAYGSEYGGNEPSAWQATAKVGTVAAGATSYTYNVPASWGSDDNLVLRFYFLDNGFPAWSTSVFWRDLSAPALGDLTLNGRGGDTLVVSGDLVSFGGSSCALKVRVGQSADALDTVWTGLEGSVRTAAGAYELTLFEAAPAAARYLKPGETYFVCVEATANGKTSRTGTAKVRMSEKAVYDTTASAVARRTVTFTGSFADLGMADRSEVSLWVGNSGDESTFEQSGDPLVVTDRETFTFTHTFPAFETTYYWQFRAANESAGKTANVEARTAVASCKTLDTTTYTWTGGESGDWSDPANWSDNQSGDTLGYPNTSAATASFPAKQKVTVRFTEPLTIGWMYLNAGGVDVTFAQGGESTNATMLTVTSTFNFDGTRGRLTLDNVALKTPGVTVGAQSEVILTNAANWYSTSDFWADKFGGVRLYGDSTLNCNQFGLGGGDSVISDSTLWTRSNDFPGRTNKGGAMRFAGTHPLWWHNASGSSFYSSLANAGYRFDFVVPVGGFTAPVIRGPSNLSYYMGNNQGNPGSSPIAMNVLDESPANRVDATITTPLVSWPKGINKAMIVEGTLPDDGAGTDDSFVWGEGDYPATLGVTIVGSTHGNALTVTGTPEAIPAEALSPSYGEHAVGQGASQVCTAPSETIQLSDVKRATCRGWKLYAVDAATHVRTLVDSGEGASMTFTNVDGLWHELEWQWKVEYKITVTSAGNGTATADEEWVETGKKARFSVAPSDGYAFGKWTGDVDLQRDKTENLFFTVRNRPYTLTANFLKAVYVSSAGSDGNGGSGWGDAFATIAKGVAANPGGAVLVAPGDYPVTAQIVVSTGTAVIGAGEGAVVRCTAPISDDNNPRAEGTIFKLGHADAALKNLTITTDYNPLVEATKGLYARGVWIEQAGLVDGCVITNCRAHYVNDSGAGVYLNGGGIVRNTTLIRNSARASGANDASGCGVYFNNGGLVENCRIVDGNPYPSYNASTSAAVAMKNGTLRNCLVANNTQSHTVQGSALGVGIKIESSSSPVIENCTIAGNFMMGSSTVGGLLVTGGSGAPVIRNTILWDNRNSVGVLNWVNDANAKTILSSHNCTTPTFGGAGDITSDPGFVDAVDYRTGLSDVVDAGEYLDWMADSVDLDGHERVLGSAPDMGCYEFEVTGLACGFSVAAEGRLDEDAVTLVAAVQGDLAGLVYMWTIVDQDGKTVTRSGADLATLQLGLTTGRYSVTLEVQNANGDRGTASKPNAAEVFAKDVYVSVGGTDEYPYASYATGASNLDVALAAASDGTVVHVDDGFYSLADSLIVAKGVTVISENGPEAVTIHATPKVGKNAMVMLGHADAVLSGVTVDGINAAGKRPQLWGALSIAAAGGTVTNCIVRNQDIVNNSVDGSGCRLSGGRVVDSVFSNNYTRCSGGQGMRGGAIYMDGDGLVDRCRIVGNSLKEGGPSYGGGVYMKAGVLRNSLLADNYSNNYGGGVAVEGSGRVVNCTLVKNRAREANGAFWQGGGAVLDCLVWNNEANGQAEDVEDPGFKDAQNGDFRLVGASAAIDAGTAVGIGDMDLDGKPRVSGDAADMGCYEYDQSQFAIGIAYEKLAPFAPGVVRFLAKANPKGTVLDEDKTWWTFDGSEPSADNYAAKGSVVEKMLEPSVVTVRFKTVYQGEAHQVDNVGWFVYYGESVYLDAASENPTLPYATRETAATSYADAIACLQENATLRIAPGTYPVQATTYLTKPMTILGEQGPSRTVLDLSTTSWSGPYAFNVQHAGAVVSGLAITNVKTASGSAGVTIAEGVVTNCVFANSCRLSKSSGGAVEMTGGTLVDCVVTNCGFRPHNEKLESTGAAIGARPAAGRHVLIDRCRVVDCQALKNGQIACTVDGAIYAVSITTGDVHVRNTVVEHNTLSDCGGIVVGKNGRVENCTVIGNVSTNAAETAAGVKVLDASASVVNTVVFGNRWGEAAAEIGGVAGFADRFDHCLIGVDPQLRGKGAKAYRPTSASPCLDAGRTLNWMTEALDLYGQPRVQGPGAVKRPDIGAAEYRPSGFGLWVK